MPEAKDVLLGQDIVDHDFVFPPERVIKDNGTVEEVKQDKVQYSF